MKHLAGLPKWLQASIHLLPLSEFESAHRSNLRSPAKLSFSSHPLRVRMLERRLQKSKSKLAVLENTGEHTC